MVATSHPAVTEAALAVLRQGGNAVDAMLTALPLQQVLEPQLSSIAGGFGMLHWDAARGRGSYLNANPDHPTGGAADPAATPDTSGRRVGVPGTVVGMRAAADRFGTRPWDSYFAPAIEAAENGFALYGQLLAAMTAAQGRLGHHATGRQRFLRDGYLPRIGQPFRQPELAWSLRRIAAPDGVEWFQVGEFARRFAGAVRDTGGSMTPADLGRYRARWSEPLRCTYRGHELLGAPLPDTGGLFCALALGFLERLGLDRYGPWSASARSLALVARALTEAEAQVDRHGADPLARPVPLDVLLSVDHLDLTAQLLAGTAPSGAPPEAHDEQPTSVPRPPTGVGSNQIVIVDPTGNWVSTLHTAYGTDFGTGLVVGGVSTNGANVFPGVAVGEGRRVVAPLASTIVLRDGRPVVGLGTPGFPPPAVVLVLLHLLDHGWDLPTAVEAPRFTVGPASAVGIETRVPRATFEGLADLGTDASPLGDFSPATGRFQAVGRDHRDGGLVGVVDSRGSGHAAGI